MYYLVNKYANVDRRIVTEKHNIVQAHLKEADEGWDAEQIIMWMWGIDKKSDNIIDLIEEGDLVRQTYETIYHTVNDSFALVTSEYIEFLKTCNKVTVDAIYKPNSKGDFIIAWKREK